MTNIVVFKRRPLWDSIRRLSPSYRREQDARLRAGIKRLLENPKEPCIINGRLIQP